LNAHAMPKYDPAIRTIVSYLLTYFPLFREPIPFRQRDAPSVHNNSAVDDMGH